MTISDIINKIWTIGTNGKITIRPLPRDGHIATFLPDTGEIIYVGGINFNGQSNELIDITNLHISVMCIFFVKKKNFN